MQVITADDWLAKFILSSDPKPVMRIEGAPVDSPFRRTTVPAHEMLSFQHNSWSHRIDYRRNDRVMQLAISSHVDLD